MYFSLELCQSSRLSFSTTGHGVTSLCHGPASEDAFKCQLPRGENPIKTNEPARKPIALGNKKLTPSRTKLKRKRESRQGRKERSSQTRIEMFWCLSLT